MDAPFSFNCLIIIRKDYCSRFINFWQMNCRHDGSGGGDWLADFASSSLPVWVYGWLGWLLYIIIIIIIIMQIE